MTYKTECERCGRGLAGLDPAFVCSYDCTFCADCTRGLDWSCPNCLGELTRRARRASPKGPRSDRRGRTPARNARVIIDRATLKDLEDASSLFDAYRQFYHQRSDRTGARRFLRDRLTRNDSVIFLARGDGRAVGFAQLYPHFSSTRLGRLWNVNDLFVTPDFRGRGVASRLLRRCEQLAAETGAIGAWLETAVDNPAQRLYASRGWKLDREFLHFDWNSPAPGASELPARPVRARPSHRTKRSRRR